MMKRPHVVIFPFPSQGHINPMLQLAKLLHLRGSHITFINTESSHNCILQSEGPDALKGLEDFRFETIPDGLLLPESESRQNVIKGCIVTFDNCAEPLRELLVRLDADIGSPPITCFVPNGLFSFALDVADGLGIPSFVFWTMSACGFMGYLHLEELVRRGYTPLKDDSYLTNGYLDTPIDWIPGMKGILLRDLPSFIRTVDRDDFFLNSDMKASKRSLKAQGLILNTFDDLESDVLDAMKRLFPKVYTIGPCTIPLTKDTWTSTTSLSLSLWEEDHDYGKWLDSQRTGSVIYVNFGSIATVTSEQLEEFACGLANSEHPFLWVIRPDMVIGGPTGEFLRRGAYKGRSGFLASWCDQEAVLSHGAVGGFLTHCGWNSTLESICGGVPMICWPGFGEQHTNARYICKEWGIGVEMEGEVKREEVAGLVKELMGGEKGEEIRMNVGKWREKGKEAATEGGSSFRNLEEFSNSLCGGKMRPLIV